MKVLLVLCAVVGVAVGTFQCHKGADATAAAAATDCADVGDDPQTKCSGPNFVKYTGYVKPTEVYKCGECAAQAGDEPKECKECTDTACNKPLEVHTFKCTEFKWDTDAKTFAAQKDVTICHALKTEKAVCNSNGAEAKEEYEVLNKGCGPCADDAKKDTCVQCEGDNCNSAATITAFLLPMVALIYTLF